MKEPILDLASTLKLLNKAVNDFQKESELGVHEINALSAFEDYFYEQLHENFKETSYLYSYSIKIYFQRNTNSISGTYSTTEKIRDHEGFKVFVDSLIEEHGTDNIVVESFSLLN